jgi:hypothetical protein
MGCGKSKTIGIIVLILDMSENKDKEAVVDKKFFKLYNEISYSIQVLLKDLLLDKNTFYDLLTALGCNNSILHFTMDNVETKNNCDVLISLSNILTTKSNLKSIEFYNLKNLGKNKGKSIFKIIQECRKIEKIVLKSIELEEDDEEYIKRILKQSTRLTYFELCGVKIVDFNKIYEGLNKNIIIESLILSDVSLNNKDFEKLIPSICTNTSLVKIDLSFNQLGESVKIFFDKIECFKLLSTIIFNKCEINDEILQFILVSIKNNLSIKSLEVINNFITKDSENHFIEFFKENKTIESIFLLNNHIKKENTKNIEDKDIIKLILDE